MVHDNKFQTLHFDWIRVILWEWLWDYFLKTSTWEAVRYLGQTTHSKNFQSNQVRYTHAANKQTGRSLALNSQTYLHKKNKTKQNTASNFCNHQLQCATDAGGSEGSSVATHSLAKALYFPLWHCSPNYIFLLLRYQ